MKVQIRRGAEYVDMGKGTTTIEINGNRYRLSESNDCKLTINKISLDGTNDCVKIRPRSGNEIELS
jgi:hypothetical protein